MGQLNLLRPSISPRRRMFTLNVTEAPQASHHSKLLSLRLPRTETEQDDILQIPRGRCLCLVNENWECFPGLAVIVSYTRRETHGKCLSRCFCVSKLLSGREFSTIRENTCRCWLMQFVWCYTSIITVGGLGLPGNWIKLSLSTILVEILGFYYIFLLTSTTFKQNFND